MLLASSKFSRLFLLYLAITILLNEHGIIHWMCRKRQPLDQELLMSPKSDILTSQLDPH